MATHGVVLVRSFVNTARTSVGGLSVPVRWELLSFSLGVEESLNEARP
jgi:hypothetical protein